MKPKDLLELDYQNATKPPQADPESPAEAMYRALAVEPNAHASEFLATSNPDLLLPSIRSHLLRGDFERGEEKIERLAADTDDDVAISEAALEKARLAALRGQWGECPALCDAALALRPSPITQLSVMQIRALALSELGQFVAALADVDMILSQATRYPHAVAVGFSKAQRIKIRLRTDGVTPVDPELRRLWSETLNATPLNLDLVLVLLRLEIDRRRLLGQTFAELAMACVRVAEALGDRLYEGLAWLDLISGVSQPAPRMIARVNELVTEFERLRALRDDAELPKPRTISGQGLRNSVRADLAMEAPPRHAQILLSHLGCWIDLEKPAVRFLSGNLDWLKLAPELASPQGMEKGQFFASLWQQKFVSDLHDGVLRTFFSRLKTKSGVSLKNSSGWISLPDFLVV